MKHINELTLLDYEHCVDSAEDSLVFMPEIIEFLDTVDQLSKMHYNSNFVSATFITDLIQFIVLKTQENTPQQLETFGAQVLSNINLKLNE